MRLLIAILILAVSGCEAWAGEMGNGWEAIAHETETVTTFGFIDEYEPDVYLIHVDACEMGDVRLHNPNATLILVCADKGKMICKKFDKNKQICQCEEKQ